MSAMKPFDRYVDHQTLALSSHAIMGCCGPSLRPFRNVNSPFSRIIKTIIRTMTVQIGSFGSEASSHSAYAAFLAILLKAQAAPRTWNFSKRLWSSSSSDSHCSLQAAMLSG
ncbi:hypothetical protein BU24DRAFT_420860 [Aaosphaeria arxii CBS 175.79]|uniref:Uncharacterized protein n=1 Tax=Aaosphaeria arxii CBS 175.79 TaxID=1450172 RepID=A0A6A5XZT4_9PLEO|nr:uncharacterized protein BU24DRAFT_420860 [Aaosphaeria arxii CBS 175.79]KAF2017804.1 hypothetical protein BU24DRAFT_420860 [Aaosphaeria arxii CBS 175.79]